MKYILMFLLCFTVACGPRETKIIENKGEDKVTHTVEKIEKLINVQFNAKFIEKKYNPDKSYHTVVDMEEDKNGKIKINLKLYRSAIPEIIVIQSL